MVDKDQDHNQVEVMVDPSTEYRARALRCETRAGEAIDSKIKLEWEALAMERHLIAHVAAPEDDVGIEIA